VQTKKVTFKVAQAVELRAGLVKCRSSAVPLLSVVNYNAALLKAEMTADDPSIQQSAHYALVRVGEPSRERQCIRDIPSAF
jgi:hypothetical protein